MDLKGLLADQMGHFTPYDIPGILLAMLLAAVLAFALGLFVRMAHGPSGRQLAALAAVVALAVALVRASVPLSIALVALALLLRGGAGGHEAEGATWKPHTLRLAAIAIGVGCGSSAGVIVLAVFIPLGLLLRWAFNGSHDRA